MSKVIAAFSVISLIAGCGSPHVGDLQPVVSQAETPASEPVDGITVRGVVESVTSRNVYGTLSFMMDQIFVEEGDYVTEGQILGVLDTEDLELTIAQERASLESTRQRTRQAVQETGRMLAEASENLANNTNMHILSSEAALDAAERYLETAQQNYDNALQDYRQGNDPQVVIAESSLRTAGIELERIERNHENSGVLYAGGILSSDEMRQSENALTHARNRYNDARVSYENAVELQRRSMEQLRIALQSATTSYQSARELLNASRVAARQDIERLRSSVSSAEISANLEHMEIALQMLERQMEDSTITAPVSGTVTSVVAREGASGMGLLFVIEDTDNLKVTTSFREYDIGRLETGMEVIISSDATGSAEYTGIITRINPAATAVAPVVEFEAEVLVTSVSTGLRIGMNTRLNIILE